MTTLVCACCGRVRQGDEKQPKQLAKKLRWKHGKAKGSWVCPECKEFMPVQPK
jgi:uncharacterized protein YlaI